MAVVPPPLLEICNETRQKQMKRKEKKERNKQHIFVFFFFFMFIYPYNVDKHEIFLKFSLQLPYENFLDPRMVSLFITIPFLNIKKNQAYTLPVGNLVQCAKLLENTQYYFCYKVREKETLT